MRYLLRIQLPSRVCEALEADQRELDRQIEAERAEPGVGTASCIEEFWKTRRSKKALKAVEAALRAMASGLARCMYCEDSEGCDVEHGYPKAHYPSRAYEWPNLLWICTPCNRQKNSGFEEDLINPTREDPLDHLVLAFRTGRYTVRDNSPCGDATLRVVRRLASEPTLTAGRQNAVVKLRSILSNYDRFEASGNCDEADEIRRAVVEEPFSAVFAAVLRATREPGAVDILGEELVAMVSRHPAMHDWLKEADQARAAAVMPALEDYARELRIRK